MCVLSIKVPIQKKLGNLFNDPCMCLCVSFFRYSNYFFTCICVSGRLLKTPGIFQNFMLIWTMLWFGSSRFFHWFSIPRTHFPDLWGPFQTPTTIRNTVNFMFPSFFISLVRSNINPSFQFLSFLHFNPLKWWNLPDDKFFFFFFFC